MGDQLYYFSNKGYFKGVLLPLLILLPMIITFQNCSMAKFGGRKGPVYNANGDGHEGKLSIPIDHTVAQSNLGYQPTVLFDLNGLTSSNSTLDRMTSYCRSQQSSDSEGLDIVISKPANQWVAASEFYTFNGSLPSGADFTRASRASYWDSSGVLTFANLDEPRFQENSRGENSLLLESEAENLSLWSTILDNPVWNRRGITAESHLTELSPDGNNLSFVIAETNTVISDRSLEQPISGVPPGDYTHSFFTKPLALGRQVGVAIREDGQDSRICRFDFQSEQIEVFTNQGDFECSVMQQPDGWFRVSISMGLTLSDVVVEGYLIDPIEGLSFPFTGHPGVLIWGSQFEAGTQATSFIESEGSTGVRDSDRLALRRFSPQYSEANVTATYEFSNINSELEVDLGNQSLTNAVRGDELFERLNAQVTASGLNTYKNGRWSGQTSLPGLFVGLIDVQATQSSTLLSEIAIDNQAYREELMAVSSLPEIDSNRSYGVLVLGRGNDRVQTQPVAIDLLSSGAFVGVEHHFSLSDSTREGLEFIGSLDDGTLFKESMTCLEESEF